MKNYLILFAFLISSALAFAQPNTGTIHGGDLIHDIHRSPRSGNHDNCSNARAIVIAQEWTDMRDSAQTVLTEKSAEKHKLLLKKIEKLVQQGHLHSYMADMITDNLNQPYKIIGNLFSAEADRKEYSQFFADYPLENYITYGGNTNTGWHGYHSDTSAIRHCLNCPTHGQNYVVVTSEE